MKFVPTFKESHTKNGSRCEYCGYAIYLRIDRKIETYTLNGKDICLRCLRDYADIYGMTLKDLIGG